MALFFLQHSNKREVKSQHLLFGNPSEARYSDSAFEDNPFNDNLLLERPQYALSYNATTKNPNWVSYQLNSSWLGDVKSFGEGAFIPDETLPQNFYRVQPEGDIKRTDGENVISSERYDRGHMVAVSDRSRTEKDVQSTYLMTNILPQSRDNNSQIWSQFEQWTQNLARSGKELYIITGGDGELKTLPPSGESDSNNSPIRVPSHLWKAVLILDRPGQTTLDVEPETMTFAFYVPNDATFAGNKWFDSQYLKNIDYLETQIQLDLFSNIPDSIESTIEALQI